MPQVGSDALTGVGLCFPILTLISAFASLLCAGGAPRAAIRMGQQENRAAEKIMGNCFGMLIAASVLSDRAVSDFCGTAAGSVRRQ